MKILLTGATGFIGSYILRNLCTNSHVSGFNYTVMATYRDEAKIDRSTARCEWILLDDHWLDKARAFDPDVIIHTAWVGVTAVERDDLSIQQRNIQMHSELLELKPYQFIAIGSQAEYGTYDAVVDEEFPTNPTSAYGVVKLQCLNTVRNYCEQHNIHWHWFRVFSSFGPGEADTWLIPSTVKKMQTETEMDTTYGEQRYSYLYVGEIARVIVKSIAGSTANGIYNLSGSKTISIRELLETIQRYVNPSFKLNFGAIPYRPGQSMMMGCDNRKVCKSVCEVIDQDFDDRLKQTIESYL